MALNVPVQELEAILTIVAKHPRGVGIAALADALALYLHKPLLRRTLQRRLDHLIKNEQVVSTGQSVACLYKLRSKNAIAATLPTRVTEIELYVPLSDEGLLIRDQVRQALMHRRPVGYQREFLEAYKPGVNWYLPAPIRAQLHEIGCTSTGKRVAGTHARDILNRLLVDLSWASSRLEGNTYSRLDTQNLIEFGQAAPGKDARETQMILNHKAAIEMLVENADEVGFNAFTFQNLHAVLSQNLMHEDEASGRLRRRPVEISGTVFHPLTMPQLLESFFQLLLQKADAIPDPFEQAFFLMVQLPYLQPFEDVNKRVSRIGANISLIKHNLCPLSFIDVPERAYVEGTLAVYELNRIELLRDVFVWAYERSCQRYLAITHNLADPDPLKIQHREALIEGVQAIVQGKLKPTQKTIRQLAQKLVSAKNQKAFERLLAQAILQLHESSVARYRLKRSEFLAWRAVVA